MRYSSEEEVQELAKVVAPYGGTFPGTHAQPGSL